jgi:hypothetical protein
MIQAIFFIALIYVVIAGLWMQLEKLIYKEVTPRMLDDFIALALATSLYFNIY